jgi:hypothetical protein
MSNRFQDRITVVSGSTPVGCVGVTNCPGQPLVVTVTGCVGVVNCPFTNLNTDVVAWGGTPVSPAVLKQDDLSPIQSVPEIGAILQALDGISLQRMRATLDRVLLAAEAYFRRGEDPIPSTTSLVEDSLRVKGSEVPYQVHLPETGLQAYPIFTGQPPFMIPKGVTEVTFTVTYYPAGEIPAACQGRVRAMLGNGAEEAPEVVLNSALTVAQPYARESAYIFEVDLPIPQDFQPLVFKLPVRVPRGETSIRLVGAEIGDVGGTVMAISLTAGT